MLWGDENLYARQAIIISSRAVIIFLVTLFCLSMAAFCAGWKWRDMEARHFSTVQSVSEMQRDMGNNIDALRERTINHGDSLAALWRCYHSLARKVVLYERK